MYKNAINDIIKADLYRYYGNTSYKIFLKCFFTNPGFKFTYFLRKCSFYCGKNLKSVFFKLFYREYSIKYGFDIDYNSEIGKGLYIGHYGGIVINPEVKIGKNVNINHGVTIGQTNRGSRKGVPVIGNKVWIGAHAIIVGKIVIGDNVLIGPGAYVNFDVSENAVVIGNPGKIISFNGTEGYINRAVD